MAACRCSAHADGVCGVWGSASSAFNASKTSTSAEAYRSGRGNLVDVVAPVGGHDRISVLTAVAGQVFCSHHTASVLDGRHYSPPYAPLVETCRVHVTSAWCVEDIVGI